MRQIKGKYPQKTGVVMYRDVNINLVMVNFSMLQPLKAPENRRFSGDFMGYKMETSVKNGLNLQCASSKLKSLSWHELRQIGRKEEIYR